MSIIRLIHIRIDPSEKEKAVQGVQGVRAGDSVRDCDVALTSMTRHAISACEIGEQVTLRSTLVA
jgi:hypothetical protein